MELEFYLTFEENDTLNDFQRRNLLEQYQKMLKNPIMYPREFLLGFEIAIQAIGYTIKLEEGEKRNEEIQTGS